MTTTLRPEQTAAIMAETGLTEAVLHDLVHRFYARVRRDPVLGPIFAARIADWDPHLKRMIDFLSSVTLMTGRYNGRPVPAHTPLPIRAAHFDRWLTLFHETAQEVCTPAGANHVILRAERIACSLDIAVVEAQTAPDAVPTLCRRKDAPMTDTAPVHDAAELTRHIEIRYHAGHRNQLPQLAEMAERVEAVHFGDEDVPEGLSVVLRRMIGEMEVHMKKEELVLFPAIRKGGRPGIENQIAAMRADHDDHAAGVAQIRSLTRGLALPKGACGTWAALFAGLAEFIDDIEEHMRLENEILFPQFEPSDPVRD